MGRATSTLRAVPVLMLLGCGTAAPHIDASAGADAGRDVDVITLDAALDATLPDAPVALDTTPLDATLPDALDAPVLPDVASEAAPDASDATLPDDVVDASPDADTALDVADEAPSDVSEDYPAVEVASPPDVQSVGCAMPVDTITLPGAPAPIVGYTGGASTILSTSCQSDASGPEDVYSLVVTARTGVIVDTANASTNFDTIVAIRARCGDPSSELACNDDGGATPAHASVARAVLDSGTYSVIVDGHGGQAGTYVLRARTFVPADNVDCDGPMTVTPGTTVTGQDLAASGANSVACGVLDDGGALYYSVTVPAMSRVDVTVNTAAGGWTPQVRVLDSCSDDEGCVAARAGTAAISLVNGGAAPRPLVVVVSRRFVSVGTFTFAVSAPAMMALGTECTAPIPLASGVVLTGRDTSSGAAPNGACVVSSDGAQLFYSLRVTPSHSVRVTATSTGAITRAPVLRVLDGCASTSCSDLDVSVSATDPASVFVDNTGAVDREAIVSLSTGSRSAPGIFTVSAALNSFESGASCGRPLDLAPGVRMHGLGTSAGHLANRDCFPHEGPQIYYRVAVPARRSAVFHVMPASGAAWTPRVRALNDCGALACASSATSPTMGAPAELAVLNDTDAMALRLFSVAATSPAATTGPYDVEADVP